MKNIYSAKDNVTVEDIIEFHAEFEYIHPFQDDHVIIRTKLEKPGKIKGLALIESLILYHFSGKDRAALQY